MNDIQSLLCRGCGIEKAKIVPMNDTPYETERFRSRNVLLSHIHTMGDGILPAIRGLLVIGNWNQNKGRSGVVDGF